MVTVAYLNQAAHTWNRKPIFLIARTVEPLALPEFANARSKRIGDKKYLEIGPDLGIHVAGERTMVLASIDDLKGVLEERVQGPPGVILPTNVGQVDFFYGTQTFCVAADLTSPENRLISEFEFFGTKVADATLSSYRKGVFDYPQGFPRIFADLN